jgi:UDP-N-acetylmuramoylalanine--D-glutamate ligase
MNVTLDHLARHGTMENYAAVKARIYRNQGPGDAAILNADDSWTTAMTAPENTALWTYSLDRARGMASFGPRLSRDIWLSGETILAEGLPIASTGDTPLQGRHNMQNVLAALTMMRAGGFPWPKVLEGLRTFCGVEHRLEFAGEWNGIRFINDSKATNVDSLKVALETFEEPVILIAGGEGKQSDYTVLNGLVRKHVRELVTLGLDAPNIEAAWGEIAPFHRVADMGEAVECAARLARQGEVVLLSPACASFDMYQSFEHRGRDFKERVLAFIGKNGGDGRHET